MSDYIARFNPYNMDDDTVLSVATGREPALEEVMTTLRDNLTREGAHQHLMVYGPRGRGKSFFLKYLGIRFGQDPMFQNCRFVSLPEEQSNVRFASDVVRMILSQIEGSGFQSVIPLWREPEELWQQHYSRLENWCRGQIKQHEKFMLVVVLENFNDLLETLDDAGLHRLRHMMEHLPGFTLIGASPRIHVDGDYNNPIFHIFKSIMLATWDEGDYLAYFGRRRDLESARTGRKWSATETRLQDAKLKAISQFTGGSPRMAVVLTDLLLKDNLVSTAQTLYGLVDELTPYYQDLIKELRKRANSLALFDALIRHGENLSQSELAERVGARQNEISRAFSWLHENGYVTGKKRQESKEYRYFVSDRVFVLYYLRREVLHNESYTSIWLLADFLVEFYSEKELRQHAFFHAIQDPSPETRDILRVWMRKKGMPEENYKHEQSIENLLNFTDIPGNAYSEVAMNLANNGEYRKAKEYCEKLLNKHPLPQVENLEANIYAVKAYILAKEGDLEQATVSLDIAMNIQSNEVLNGDTLTLFGIVKTELGHHEAAIEQYQKALRLYNKEDSINEKALIFTRIGMSFFKTNQFEVAIKYFQEAEKLFFQLENIEGQGCSLSLIGICFNGNQQYNFAIEQHKKAAELLFKTENIHIQAVNIGQIGLNLQKSGQHKAAIEQHQKAIELHVQIEDIKHQAWNIGQIGLNFELLNQHEAAIDQYQKAAELYAQIEDIKHQAGCIGQIGWNLRELYKYESANLHHEQSMALQLQYDPASDQSWNIGQICVNLYLAGQSADAWQLLLNATYSKTMIFSQWGYIIAFKERHTSTAEAFRFGYEILYALREYLDKFDIMSTLTGFHIVLLKAHTSNELMVDLATESKKIFVEDINAQGTLDMFISVIDYLESLKIGKGEVYLENLHPDISIAVQAIAREIARKLELQVNPSENPLPQQLQEGFSL